MKRRDFIRITVAAIGAAVPSPMELVSLPPVPEQLKFVSLTADPNVIAYMNYMNGLQREYDAMMGIPKQYFDEV